MKLRIRLYAILSDYAGKNIIEVELPDHCTGNILLDTLGKLFPHAQQTIKRSAIAVNETYLNPEETISPNAEVAIIPPVSGGI